MSTSYDFTVTRNDTFNGTQFTITVNSTLLDLTGYSIKMAVKSKIKKDSVLTLTSTSGITISNSTAGVFQVDSQIFTQPAGKYVYDIQLTSSSGVVKTYVSGNFDILPDITE